jgi:hypothetical protein
MNRNILLTLISIFIVAGLILSACAPSAEPTQAPAEEAAQKSPYACGRTRTTPSTLGMRLSSKPT